MSEAAARKIEVEPWREAFHAERKGGIGGSEIPVILGLSTRQTQLDLFLVKSGIKEPEDLARKSSVVRAGLKQEAVTAEWFAEEAGYEVWEVHDPEHPGKQRLFVHADRPLCFSHPDRLYRTPDGQFGVAELKFTAYDRKKWIDGTPEDVYAQAHWNGWVVDHDLHFRQTYPGERITKVAIVVSLSAVDYAFAEFDLDTEFAEKAAETAEAWFMKHVAAGEAPPPTAKDSEALGILYGKPKDISVRLPDEAVAWNERALEAKDEIKKWKDIQDLNENLIRSAIGDAVIGLLPNGQKLTWKPQQQHRVDTAALPDEIRKRYEKVIEFRVLRRAGK